jgi:hypothetical protein
LPVSLHPAWAQGTVAKTVRERRMLPTVEGAAKYLRSAHVGYAVRPEDF